MKTTAAEMRMERIDRLLHELEHETTRGIMEGEIEETFCYQFIIPVSAQITNGIVHCCFRSRPMHRHSMFATDLGIGPKLRVVK